MSVLASTLTADDNMGTGTPNFFSSAWDPDQNEFGFIDNYPADGESYDGLSHSFQPHAQQDQLDYFSSQQGNRFAQSYAAEFDSSLLGSNFDLNPVLEDPAEGKGMLETGLGQPIPPSPATTKALNLNPFEIFNREARMRAVAATLGDSTVLDPSGLEVQPMDTCGLDVKPALPILKLGTDLLKINERKTSVLHGQITPGDSPIEDRLPAQEALKTSSSPLARLPRDLLASKKPASPKTKKRPGSSADAVPKVRRPRKSKKKPLTKEQEEAKRQKFLERNRVAADKCRQNRKKWIDDLQDKAHFLSVDNAEKKSIIEKLEQDISQLKALLFVHSGRCTDRSIAMWLEQESARVKKRAENMPKYVSGDISQGLDDLMSPMGHPLPTCGLENAFSVTNGGDDKSSTLARCESPSKDIDCSGVSNCTTHQVAVKRERLTPE